jgi:hypothetical protein
MHVGRARAGVRFHVHLDVRPVEIFDLEIDPFEQEPDSGRRHPRVHAALDALLERFHRACPREERVFAPDIVPAELRDQLRSLGYLR